MVPKLLGRRPGATYPPAPMSTHPKTAALMARGAAFLGSETAIL